MDGRARIIDRSWPTRGAAWVDPAILILRLLEAGHTLVEADTFDRGPKEASDAISRPERP